MLSNNPSLKISSLNIPGTRFKIFQRQVRNGKFKFGIVDDVQDTAKSGERYKVKLANPQNLAVNVRALNIVYNMSLKTRNQHLR